MSIYSEVASFLSRYKKVLIGDRSANGGAPLVIGVSGGPDSMTLLHVLAQRGLYDKSKLVVAHLNHHLRPSAVQDATYVMSTAVEWGLTYHQGDFDVADLARSKGLGIEHAGRIARYRFLASVAELVGARAILTAHTADDQVETVLMHLLRGAGLGGLRGIFPIVPNPEAPQFQIVRPMLDIWREEVVAYCDKFELNPVIDPTNVDISYFRNRIRNNLIPLLLEYNPGVQKNLHNLATLVSADYDILEEQVRESWSELLVSEDSNEIRVDLLRWRSLSLGIRRKVIRLAWSKLCSTDKELGFRTLELARQVAEAGSTGNSVNLPAGVVASVEYDQFVFKISLNERLLDDFPQIRGTKNIALNEPGNTALNHGWQIQSEPLTKFNYTAIKANADPWTAFICTDQLGELAVRPRIAGEGIRPLGMGGHSKKVSELMIDEKIPAQYRENWPLLANNSEVVWIAGHQLDDSVQVTPGCECVVKIQFRRVARG